MNSQYNVPTLTLEEGRGAESFRPALMFDCCRSWSIGGGMASVAPKSIREKEGQRRATFSTQTRQKDKNHLVPIFF